MAIKITQPSKSLEKILEELLDTIYGPAFAEKEREIAEEMKADLINKIETNFWEYTNAPNWAAEKRRMAASTKGSPRKTYTEPLVLTKEYINAIEVQKEGKYGYTIGIRDMIHPPLYETSSPITMKQLALILEYGATSTRNGVTRSIPPRPHWQPIIAEWTEKLGTIEERLTEMYAEAQTKAQELFARQETITKTV